MKVGGLNPYPANVENLVSSYRWQQMVVGFNSVFEGSMKGKLPNFTPYSMI